MFVYFLALCCIFSVYRFHFLYFRSYVCILLCFYYCYILFVRFVTFLFLFFFFKQKPAYEMRISDWSSDVCSSDLATPLRDLRAAIGTLRDELGTLRWDSWKTLEWQVTGKQGALAPSDLAARLASLGRDIEAASALARTAESEIGRA